MYYSLVFGIVLTAISATAKTASTPINDIADSTVQERLNIPGNVKGTVDVQLYYESLCRYSRAFITEKLAPVLHKFGQFIELKIYPFGIAHTYENGTDYMTSCQHGPAECYGNKLHACALDQLQNYTQAVFFISCMMEKSRDIRGSDDKAADDCGQIMDIDTEAIKQCANSTKGNLFLKISGEESSQIEYWSVPWPLVNGVHTKTDIFIEAICKEFKQPALCL